MLNTTMRRIGTRLALLFIAAALLPWAALAQETTELTLTPVVIDEKAKPRDILKESLTIVNTSERKLSLYPAVNDVQPEDGEKAFTAALNGEDRAASLANWIELSRGVIELGPGEEKTIPFVIRVNLNAVPGEYHAHISFSEGSTREAAEAKPELAKVVVNVEVQADVKETLQLNKFFTENIFFSGDDVLFNYQLENIGNQDLQPKGEIRIYDRKGKEVASVEVNKEGKTFAPDQMSQLASVWSAANGFGKYKAFLNIDYGSAQKASVQDTVYFWIIPWQQLLGIAVASFVAIIFLALHFYKVLDARHHAQLVHAGVPMPAAHAPVVPPSTELGRELRQKRWFNIFSRSKLPIHPESMILPGEAPERPKPSLREAFADQHMQPAVPQRTEKPQTRSGTIDLKAMNTHPHHESAPPKPSHVINLKGR